jgi:diguanylate cyclase (GGDEF)-like protein/PAS domain S-box-containing protein
MIKFKILIVDDTAINLMILQRALESEYDVTIARSGDEALSIIEKQAFALVLLDIVMPGLDGFAVFKMLRQIPHASETPVIFITGQQSEDFEFLGLELGAIDFTFKPIKTELIKLRIRNILHLASIQKKLKVSEERLHFVLDASNEGVWDWSVEDDFVSHNSAWCKILALPEAHLTHDFAFYGGLIHPEDQESVRKAIDSSIQANEPYDMEYRIRRADGNYIWVYDRGRVIERSEDGNAKRMVGMIQNIQVRKEYEAEIHRLAFFDPLTDLPNRRLLLDRLTQAVIRSKRTQERGAILFIDMDRFKVLNDTHGHQMGDLLLIQVAGRITSCLRGEDTVARFGGDEFVVLLEGLKGENELARSDATRIANKILNALNMPYRLGALDYQSTPSIGISLYDSETTSIDGIISNADQAMYLAKTWGRNQIAHHFEQLS